MLKAFTRHSQGMHRACADHTFDIDTGHAGHVWGKHRHAQATPGASHYLIHVPYPCWSPRPLADLLPSALSKSTTCPLCVVVIWCNMPLISQGSLGCLFLLFCTYANFFSSYMHSSVDAQCLADHELPHAQGSSLRAHPTLMWCYQHSPQLLILLFAVVCKALGF